MDRIVAPRTDYNQPTTRVVQYVVSDNSHELMDKLFDKVKHYEKKQYPKDVNQVCYVPFNKMSSNQVSSSSTFPLQETQIAPTQTNYPLQRPIMGRMMANSAETSSLDQNVVDYVRRKNSDERIDQLFDDSSSIETNSTVANQISTRHEAPLSNVSSDQASSSTSFSLQTPEYTSIQANFPPQQSELNEMLTNGGDTNNLYSNVETDNVSDLDELMEELFDDSDTFEINTCGRVGAQELEKHEAPLNKLSLNQDSSLNSFSLQTPQFVPIQTNHLLKQSNLNGIQINSAETNSLNQDVVNNVCKENSDERTDKLFDDCGIIERNTYPTVANQISTRHKTTLTNVSSSRSSSSKSFSLQTPQFTPIQTNHSLQRPNLKRKMPNSAETNSLNQNLVSYVRRSTA